MGNTLYRDSTYDKRFGDTVFAKEIKKIITEQKSTFQGKPVNLNVAKACCSGVIKKDPSKTNIISIPFPKALNKDNIRCKTDGICIGTDYVGYQINLAENNESLDKYCAKGGVIGDIELSTLRELGGLGKSSCDGFMIDYCAKSLYDQGCIRMAKNDDGEYAAEFVTFEDNKMCLDEEKKLNYGPPECSCLNSIVGPNLNNNPARTSIAPFGDKNPYGLDGTKPSFANLFTKYSLNIFNTDPSQQYPGVLDGRCTSAMVGGDSGIAAAYALGTDTTGKVSICLNQLNISNSQIKTANLSDIKQENSCGPIPKPDKKKGTSINPEKIVDKEAIAANEKKILVENAAKQKAKDDADKANKDREKAEADKLKATLDAAKRDKEELEAMKKQMEKNKLDNDARDARIKQEALANAKKEADNKAKMEAESKAAMELQIETQNKIMKEKEEEEVAKRRKMFYIAGGILALILVLVILFFIFKSKTPDTVDSESSVEISTISDN